MQHSSGHWTVPAALGSRPAHAGSRPWAYDDAEPILMHGPRTRKKRSGPGIALMCRSSSISLGPGGELHLFLFHFYYVLLFHSLLFTAFYRAYKYSYVICVVSLVLHVIPQAPDSYNASISHFLRIYLSTILLCVCIAIDL
jgi:hypothetical protein